VAESQESVNSTIVGGKLLKVGCARSQFGATSAIRVILLAGA